MRCLIVVLFSLILLPGQATAEGTAISHSFFAENTTPQTDGSTIAPNSQYREIAGLTGFYQGQFELQSVVSHPSVRCTGTSSYSAEFYIAQQGRRIVINTPSGMDFKGRVRKNFRFRARARVTEGNLVRKLRIRGRLINTTDARTKNLERVFLNGVRACKFVHKAQMTRVSK